MTKKKLDLQSKENNYNLPLSVKSSMLYGTIKQLLRSIKIIIFSGLVLITLSISL